MTHQRGLTNQAAAARPCNGLTTPYHLEGAMTSYTSRTSMSETIIPMAKPSPLDVDASLPLERCQEPNHQSQVGSSSIARFFSALVRPMRPSYLQNSRHPSNTAAAAGHTSLQDLTEACEKLVTTDKMDHSTGASRALFGKSTEQVHLSHNSTTVEGVVMDHQHMHPASTNMADLEVLGDAQSLHNFSRTSSSSTSESDNESRSSHLRVNQVALKAQRVTLPDQHMSIATATAVKNWNGIIPGRQLKGLPLKEGKSLVICNIQNEHWYQVHQGGCFYIPSAYVRIDRWFVDCPTSSHEAKSPSRKDPEKQQNPELPMAPFSREPNDREYGENRILVSPECELDHTGRLVITFSFELIAAASHRFTSLLFKVKLPTGHNIARVQPQSVDGDSTHVHHRSSSTKGMSIKALGGFTGGLAADYDRSHTRDIEFSRMAKGQIVGGGANSDNASWSVSENVAGKSGLSRRMTFSITLQTPSPPPKVICYYDAGLARENVVERSSCLDRFDQHWEVPFAESPVPGGMRGWISRRIWSSPPRSRF